MMVPSKVRNKTVKHHDSWSFLNHPRRNDTITYNNIRKIATGQRDIYATGWLLYQSSLS